MSEAFGHQTVRARKPHQCDNCAATIPKGSLYLRQCVADGGMLQTVRVHPVCAQLVSILGYDVEDPWDWGEFREDAYAYGGAGPFPWEPRYYE
jgi:hypothetical protein